MSKVLDTMVQLVHRYFLLKIWTHILVTFLPIWTHFTRLKRPSWSSIGCSGHTRGTRSLTLSSGVVQPRTSGEREKQKYANNKFDIQNLRRKNSKNETFGFCCPGIIRCECNYCFSICFRAVW